jgi:hypothetical protein
MFDATSARFDCVTRSPLTAALSACPSPIVSTPR